MCNPSRPPPALHHPPHHTPPQLNPPQVELRVLAHLSNDPALVRLLQQAGAAGDAFRLIASTWLGSGVYQKQWLGSGVVVPAGWISAVAIGNEETRCFGLACRGLPSACDDRAAVCLAGPDCEPPWHLLCPLAAPACTPPIPACPTVLQVTWSG